MPLQKQPPEGFRKKGTLKNFTIFTGKHLFWDIFLLKLQACRPATLLKRDSNTVFSREFCEIFKKTYLGEHLRTTASVVLKNNRIFKQRNVYATKKGVLKVDL